MIRFKENGSFPVCVLTCPQFRDDDKGCREGQHLTPTKKKLSQCFIIKCCLWGVFLCQLGLLLFVCLLFSLICGGWPPVWILCPVSPATLDSPHPGSDPEECDPSQGCFSVWESSAAASQPCFSGSLCHSEALYSLLYRCTHVPVDCWTFGLLVGRSRAKVTVMFREQHWDQVTWWMDKADVGSSLCDWGSTGNTFLNSNLECLTVKLVIWRG